MMEIICSQKGHTETYVEIIRVRDKKIMADEWPFVQWPLSEWPSVRWPFVQVAFCPGAPTPQEYLSAVHNNALPVITVVYFSQ